MKFKPTGNRVLIDLDEVTTTESGLYVPQTASSGPKSGKVIDVGEYYFVGPTRVESQFHAGQRVMVDELGGQTVKVNGRQYVMVRNEDVLGIFLEDDNG